MYTVRLDVIIGYFLGKELDARMCCFMAADIDREGEAK